MLNKTIKKGNKTLLNVVAYALLITGAVVAGRSMISVAVDSLGESFGWWTFALATVPLVSVASRSLVINTLCPDIRKRDALRAEAVHAAAANTIIIGGGAVGAGAKAWLLSKNGVRIETLVAMFLTSGAIAGVGSWMLAASGLLGAATRGSISGAAFGFSVCCAMAAANLAVWWFLIFNGRLTERVGRVVGHVCRQAGVEIDADGAEGVAHVAREAAKQAISKRGLRAALWYFVSWVGGWTALYISAVSVGADEIGASKSLLVYVALRIVTVVSPLSGGVGVVEAGGVAVFAAVGLESEAGAGVIAVWRAFTWLLPSIIGWLVWGFTRRRHKRKAVETDL
jgi:uncharacterized protein (TIRG00374 family)